MSAFDPVDVISLYLFSLWGLNASDVATKEKQKKKNQKKSRQKKQKISID